MVFLLCQALIQEFYNSLTTFIYNIYLCYIQYFKLLKAIIYLEGIWDYVIVMMKGFLTFLYSHNMEIEHRFYSVNSSVISKFKLIARFYDPYYQYINMTSCWFVIITKNNTCFIKKLLLILLIINFKRINWNFEIMFCFSRVCEQIMYIHTYNIT